MKRNCGIVGITTLWLISALTAVALAALMLDRGPSRRARSQLNETKALFLAHAAALIARDGEFSPDAPPPTFSTGDIRWLPIAPPRDGLFRLCGSARVGSVEKKFEIGWRRHSRTWRAVYWREPS